MIIPKCDESIINIFKCSICNYLFYRPNELNISCAVYHSLDSCCHYGEKAINEDKLNKIYKIIKE